MKMDEDTKNVFGMRYGKESYMPINDNDLWDSHPHFLEELTYAIRKTSQIYRRGFTGDYFRLNPKEYYIDNYELKSFTEVELFRLWKAIDNLIEFREKV